MGLSLPMTGAALFWKCVQELYHECHVKSGTFSLVLSLSDVEWAHFLIARNCWRLHIDGYLSILLQGDEATLSCICSPLLSLCCMVIIVLFARAGDEHGAAVQCAFGLPQNP